MAVENKYVNANIVAGKPAMAIQSGGAEVKVFSETFEIAAADDDGSIYRVFKDVPSDLIPVKIEVGCDAITGGTDYDLGFYDVEGYNAGAVVDKDNLMDGQTLATASNFGLNGMGAVDVANCCKRFWELAGHTVTTKRKAYDICLTANTVGTAAGTVSIKMYCVQG